MKKILSTAVLVILTLCLTSCDDIDITSPAGPAGMSAYDLWVQKVDAGEIQWPAGTDEANFFKFLQGKQGEQGEAGQSGANAYESWVEYIKAGNIEDPHNPGSMWNPSKNSIVDYYNFLTGAKGDDAPIPHINPETGNWMIGNIQTDFPAQGDDGNAGTINGIITIGDNGNWHINGEDTGVKAQGNQGQAGIKDKVTIGENGNWFINGEDTGEPARGKDGEDGKDGDISSIIEIGENGNWFINGKDTEKVAQGPTGPIGPQGPGGSAGALGKIEIKDGNWWVNGVDTGEKAQGDAGAPGGRDAVTIKDGYWHINGETTNVKAQGDKGDQGSEGVGGESAYELWEEKVNAGTMEDKDGNPWPIGNNSLENFWEFLSGAPGTGAPTEVTSLEFIKSTVLADITKEEFEFTTEPNAMVYVSYRGEKIEGQADAAGSYKIVLENDKKNEIPILVSAIAKGYLESTNYLLNVKPRPASFMLGDEAKWFAANDMSLGEGNGSVMNQMGMLCGEYDITSPTRFIALQKSNMVQYATIAFSAINVQEVVVVGGINTNFIMTVNWNDDSNHDDGGVVRVELPEDSWSKGRYEITLQIVGNSQELSFVKIEAQTL